VARHWASARWTEVTAQTPPWWPTSVSPFVVSRDGTDEDAVFEPATQEGLLLSPARRTAFIAGLWFIGTFVFSIPAALLYDPVLSDANYILVQGADTQVALGAFLEILTAIANIATAVVLFPILRRQSEAISLGYVALRIVESTLIVVGLIGLLAVVMLREDLAGAGADNAALSVAGQALVALHDGTFLLGPQFCAGFGNGLLLGYRP
jgi:hypothetical protein